MSNYQHLKVKLVSLPSSKITNWDKIAQIKGIKGSVEEGLCDLYFFDESGFSLHSNVPYTWSEVGKPTRVPSEILVRYLNR